MRASKAIGSGLVPALPTASVTYQIGPDGIAHETGTASPKDHEESAA